MRFREVSVLAIWPHRMASTELLANDITVISFVWENYNAENYKVKNFHIYNT